MSELIRLDPYGPRNEEMFLSEMNQLTSHHIFGCPEYGQIWAEWEEATEVEDLPFLHVGLFKRLSLKTASAKYSAQRVLHSSSTTGTSSKIQLDTYSSEMQSISSNKILADYLGAGKAPLLILDSVKSLRQRGSVSAKIAAAMSLKQFATDMIFILENDNPASLKLDILESVLRSHDTFIVYGFSWMMWLAWGNAKFTKKIKTLLKGKTIKFVHSGGWKKLEAEKVDQKLFKEGLLSNLSGESIVLDYYGLVEQIGIVYPICEGGWRHVPVWADILIRDSYSLESLVGSIGQIQLMNSISWGAPYHNVLTEDLGLISEYPCDCGRSGKRFQLHGRIPKAEMRGCANV